jgi:3'-5' exoribonuclease
MAIADLQPGDRVEDEVYRVAQKDLRTTSSGSLYIHAVVADRTGQMVARLWNASQGLYDSMPEGGLLYFHGRVDSYKGKPQFIIEGVHAVEEGAVDPADFLPTTPQDVEAMWERTKGILRTIENGELRALIARFVNDKSFQAGFKRAPAATQNHHAYLGGLLEHTLNLLELAVLITPRYPDVSRDLVLAGIFLHDAGKVGELVYDTNIAYTNEGNLLGHLVQAVLWVHEHARQIEQETGQPFPAEIETALKHIILSHHGKFEYGSPKLPATAEAVMIHYLDNLDAKLDMVFGAIEADTDDSSDWTSFIYPLETRVFKPDVMGIRRPPGERE